MNAPRKRKPHGKPVRRTLRFFSGPGSRDMWRRINDIAEAETNSAVYALASRMQDYEEAMLRRLSRWRSRR